MKVLLAMSGGVDSSVAGALLLEQGHDVVGVTMKLWGGESDSGCCSVSDVDDARRVAQQLDIDHLVFNFGDDFDAARRRPVRRRPTPTASLPIRASSATGISSSTVCCGGPTNSASTPWPPGTMPAIGRTHDGRFTLERGADAAKDQSYVVHMLDQSALSRTLFPVGDIDKADVRRLATELGLRTASKPDSQDVCFITSTGGRQTFLGERIPFRPGRVVDAAGWQRSARSTRSRWSRSVSAAASGCPAAVRSVTCSTSTWPRGVVMVGDESQLMRDELV